VTQPQDHPAEAPTDAVAKGTKPEGGSQAEAPASDHGAQGGAGPGSLRPATAIETLADLGEWELIRRLGAFAPPGQFADDAALLNLTGGSEQQPGLGGQPGDLVPGRAMQGQPSDAAEACDGPRLVVNTDVLVEAIHFSEATTAAEDVGWRAAAANLSDLAAMGCTEVVGLTVGLVAPASTPWPWVSGVYAGLRQALDTYGGVLLGGDCSGGAQRLLAITAIGRLAGDGSGGAIRRGDGRPGDLLVCTGPHGLSRLGLDLLQGAIPASAADGTIRSQGPCTKAAPPSARTAAATGADAETCGGAAWLDPGLRLRAITAHRRPLPRFDAVRTLINCRPAAVPWRVGGCDSSDGLVAAVGAIAGASGCAARLERACLPVDPAMAGLPDAETWCLEGGEDFELVLALAPAWAEVLIAALPGATRIGDLVAGEAGALGWSDGGPWSAGGGRSGASSGYSHFS